eukprot:scaffold666686_cov66-Prasinocladus_malaysianus.AAC.1
MESIRPLVLLLVLPVRPHRVQLLNGSCRYGTGNCTSCKAYLAKLVRASYEYDEMSKIVFPHTRTRLGT